MGGGKGPPDNSAQMMQMRQDERAREDRQEAIRREELAAKEAREVAQREANKGASQQRIQAAYNAALENARQKLNVKGVGTEGRGGDVMGLLTGALDAARAGAPEIVEDASALFGPQLFDNAYNDVRTQYRNNMSRELDSFAGTGFEYERFGDTADDDILASIVGSQYDTANETLQRALARGQINEAGMGYAGQELGRQKSGANSRAQDFGSTVLQGYRDQVGNLGKQFRDSITNADLTDNFNFDVKRGRLDDLSTNLSGRMEGDIYNSVGDYSFFNTDSLLGKAANRSGTMNNNTAPVVGSTSGQLNMNSLFENDENKNTGSTGVF